MKQGKKWIALLLVCTQVLTSAPVFTAADTVDNVTTAQQAVDEGETKEKGLFKQDEEDSEENKGKDTPVPTEEEKKESETSKDDQVKQEETKETKEKSEKNSEEKSKEESKEQTKQKPEQKVKQQPKTETKPKSVIHPDQSQKQKSSKEDTKKSEESKKETPRKAPVSKEQKTDNSETNQTSNKQPKKPTKTPEKQPEQSETKEQVSQPEKAQQTKEQAKPEKETKKQMVTESATEKTLENKSEKNEVQQPSNADKTNNSQSLTEVSPNELGEGFYQIAPVKSTWDFIDLIGEDAREIGQKEDLYASVMIAQAILESGGGQSQLSRAPFFNLFGIKGAGISLPTVENSADGKVYSTLASFRKYESYQASLQDYADLLKEGVPSNPSFYKGAWKTKADSYQAATKSLAGRYATDIHYNQKLDAIIEAYDLTAYDQAEKELPDVNANVDVNINENSNYILPVQNASFSSQYGKRGAGFHRGVDLAAAQGTPIKAAKDGKVIQSGVHPSWGNYVAIEHDDGLTTLYAHCSRNIAKVGQKVKQGQTIALLGSTGHSTGPHLHFEVNRSQHLEESQLLNPLQVLNVEG